MDINEFINIYVSMILGPEMNGRGYTGFRLSNNTRIFFKNSHMHPDQVLRLKKHYKNKGIQ